MATACTTEEMTALKATVDDINARLLLLEEAHRVEVRNKEAEERWLNSPTPCLLYTSPSPRD